MDNDLLSISLGWAGLENGSVVVNEHGHTSTNSECSSVRGRAVFVHDPGVGPECKGRRVATCFSLEGGVIDDEHSG